MTELEKAADNYIEKAENILKYSDGWEEYSDWEYVKKAYINGANWMKEQMMKNAITADVGYYNQHGLSLYPEKSLEKLGFDEHDKVKIVVIKEE